MNALRALPSLVRWDRLVVFCAGAACSLPDLSWRVGCSSERGEEALLALHAEISHFLASRAVALELIHCLPTETDSSDYCVRSERARKHITSSPCLGSYSFYDTFSAR